VDTFEYDTTSSNGFFPYNFKSANYAVVNTVIPAWSDTDDDDEADEFFDENQIAGTVQVWRNVFDKDNVTSIVREQKAGWGFEDDEYYCHFYVANSEGITLSFGDTICVIDGVTRTGEVVLISGVHSFRTSSENWLDIYDSSWTEVNTEAALQAADLLYPHNHKMILEGYNYDTTLPFEGEKVYNTPVDIVAERFCTRISAHDLENNISEAEKLKYFAFLKGRRATTKPSCAILLYRDRTYSDDTNERCRLRWKAGRGLFKYLKLKAELTTEDISYTPVLYSYRIKVGL
jgi:hypothetical protein